MPKPWDKKAIEKLYNLPFLVLINKSYKIHVKNFKKSNMELCTLLSIKTGACPEDCAYCPQSGHYNTGIKKEKFLDINEIIEKATYAKKNGSKRFCMGAAWKSPPEKDFIKVLEAIKIVKEISLETCVTLGALDENQAFRLKEAGLDFYNHNLDTSPEYYKKIITTRLYKERLETLKNVTNADIKICCGGIIGMGETHEDRINFLTQLSLLPSPPTSIPINRLIPIPGTPLANTPPINNIDFIKIIAITRIMFPASVIRLAAGRKDMSEEMQTLCFMAGVNSIFYGDVLLTSKNSDSNKDIELLNKLGIHTALDHEIA